MFALISVRVTLICLPRDLIRAEVSLTGSELSLTRSDLPLTRAQSSLITMPLDLIVPTLSVIALEQTLNKPPRRLIGRKKRKARQNRS